MASIFDIDEFLKLQSGEVPAATPSAASTGTRFYNRPIQLPEGLKAAGRFGAKLLKRGIGPLGVAAGILPAAKLLKSTAEAAANAYVGAPGVRAMTPPPVTAPASLTVPATVSAEATITDDQREAALEVGRIQAQREALAQAAVPTQAPLNTAGRFMGALIGLKQISGDNALATARAKAAAADLAARGTAARGAAALQTSGLSSTLAAEYLKKNPGDFAGAAAVLHGRSEGRPQFFPGLGPNDPVIVGTPRGAVLKKRPQEVGTLERGSDGKMYLVDSAGKRRLATPAEVAQLSGR